MMKLDKQAFDEGIGTVLKCANTDILDDIAELAAALSGESENNLQQQCLENCKKFQALYNEGFLSSVDGLIKDFRAVYDITEMIEKAQKDSISGIDTAFKTSGIDASAVVL